MTAAYAIKFAAIIAVIGLGCWMYLQGQSTPAGWLIGVGLFSLVISI